MKIMDCTLRDGGYLNNWDWPVNLMKEMIEILSDEVDLIEVGYIRPKPVLSFVIKEMKVNPDNLCAMIDLKDFLNKSNLLETGMFANCIEPAKKAPFKYIRVATTYENIDEAIKAIHYLKFLGYKIFLSVMKITILSQIKKTNCEAIAKKLPIECLYVADSFGNFDCYSEYEDSFDHMGVMGLHVHNNRGQALRIGTEHCNIHHETDNYFDSSLLGMGRGAGNCATEALLLEHNKKLSTKLMNFIEDKLAPYAKKNGLQWGYNIYYHYSGLHNIHPNYVTELIKQNHPDILKKLSEIPEADRHTYKGI